MSIAYVEKSSSSIQERGGGVGGFCACVLLLSLEYSAFVVLVPSGEDLRVCSGPGGTEFLRVSGRQRFLVLLRFCWCVPGGKWFRLEGGLLACFRG